MDPSKTEKFADQATVFNGVGKQALNNALDGFNACVFAYGQTGSGKSYSMMGCPGQDGLIPRITKELYSSIDSNQESDQIDNCLMLARSMIFDRLQRIPT